jgi:arsenite transporter
MIALLSLVARHGRAVMVLGLLAGLTLPQLAAVLKPWLPEMVAGLLFLTAFRIGAPRALGGLRDGLSSLKAVVILQMALPLLALGCFYALGLLATPLAAAIILMLSAPSLTGAPNITLLLGHAPEPAFRLMILGTALMPLTVLPVLLLLPALGDLQQVMVASLRLTVTIAVTVCLAFACRHWFMRNLQESTATAVDGLTILALAVIVIGLMAALGPALNSAPWRVAQWMLVALVANFALQYACFRWLMWRGATPLAVPTAVVAGNRNFALFLIALPASTTDPLLIFLGCYQVPMYLTALVMHRIYAKALPSE